MATNAIGAGETYTTISSWEADTDNDLVSATEGEIGELKDETFTETAVTFLGATTNATYYRTLSVQSGARHDGTSGGGGAVINPGSDGHAFVVSEDHFHFEWLRVTGVTGGSSEAFRVNNNNIWWDKCIIHDLADSQGDGIYPAANGLTFKIKNCLFYDLGRQAVNEQGFTTFTCFVHNCTIYNCNASDNGDNCSIGFDMSGDPGTSSKFWLHNTHVHTASATEPTIQEGGSNNGDIDCNNCSFSDAPLGAGGIIDSGGNRENEVQADQFTSLTGGSEDFHLKAGADLIDAGDDLSGDADLAVTDDIDGESRSGTYDIGADERVTAAAALPPAGIHLNQAVETAGHW